MIRRIRGTVLSASAAGIVVDVGGVGFLVNTPARAERAQAGETVTFHTYLAVRENALDLYGFETEEELNMFLLLITLPQIGPRSALAILSQADVGLLRQTAQSGDAAYLSKISGIGKKSAEKIVAGLRDKLGAEHLSETASPQQDLDALDALLALGYSPYEAREALRALPPELAGADANIRIKAALRALGK